MANDAIAAIATPPGRGGIGVVRVSGAGLDAMLAALVGKHVPARLASRADFRDSAGAVIDQGLALYFPAPNSYTGEDVIELQAHGGPVVMQMLLRRCLELGARVAEPGEFTKRAFLNDKVDLAQAEAVADLIDASTVAAARSAARSLQGEFSDRIAVLVQALIELRTFIEATLDFPEDDTPFLEPGNLRAQLNGLRSQLEGLLAGSRQGSLLRAGIQLVIAGEPNVGKSSLLNRLAGDEVAIVSEIPGTTRDAIRQSISVRGVPVHVVDTAGLRDSTDPVEAIGISRAWEHIQKADLIVWMSDATRVDTEAGEVALSTKVPGRIPCIRVRNKIDLVGQAVPAGCSELPISAKTGYGLDELKDAILRAAGWGSENEDTFLARERHLHALEGALGHLRGAIAVSESPELVAEELKLAQADLNSICGEFSSDDLLGRIFANFCIGK